MLLVSPHLDDAALSCARLLLAGQIDCVVTVFAGIPTANVPLSEWDRLTRATSAATRMAERRAEDATAWMSIDQPFRQLNHVECDDVRIDVDAIAADIACAANGHQTVLLPAGIGGHFHHRLVRDAGLSSIKNAEIRLYGELPYAAFFGWPKESEYLDVEAYWCESMKSITPSLAISSAQITRLTCDQRRAKLRLLRHYRSQIPAVTGGSLELAEKSSLFDFEVDFYVKG